MISASDEGKTLVGALPYVTVLTSVFLGGFTFLALNGPLIGEVIETASHGEVIETASDRNLRAVLSEVLVASWSQVVQQPSLGLLVVGGLGALMVGFVIQKAAALHATLWPLILPNPKIGLYFTPRMYRWEKHAELMRRLYQNRAEKLEWEWHLFRFWIDWGIATNAFFFFGLSCCLTIRRLNDPWLLIPLLLWIGTSLFALQISALVYRNHIEACKSLHLEIDGILARTSRSRSKGEKN